MKLTFGITLGMLAVSATGLFAQAPEVDRALAAAPRNMKEGAAVVKFKADGSYETLKKGTNKMVCYDRSGEPGRTAFAAQCTTTANMERLVQNRKFEAIPDKAARQKAIDASEADGTRAKPEFGSVWIDMNGTDLEHAHPHTTIAVPGATAQSLGIPASPSAGGAWIMNAGTSTAHIMTPGS